MESFITLKDARAMGFRTKTNLLSFLAQHPAMDAPEVKKQLRALRHDIMDMSEDALDKVRNILRPLKAEIALFEDEQLRGKMKVSKVRVEAAGEVVTAEAIEKISMNSVEMVAINLQWAVWNSEDSDLIGGLDDDSKRMIELYRELKDLASRKKLGIELKFKGLDSVTE